MKKRIIILLVIALAILTTSVAFGINLEPSKKVSDFLVEDNFSKAAEKTIIENKLIKNFPDIKRILIENYDSFGFENADEVPTNLGKPFKVYKLKNMISTYKKDQSLTRVLAQDYFWEIPLLDNNRNVKSAIIVDIDKGDWNIVEVGRRFDAELLHFYSDDQEIEELLKSKYNIISANKICRVTNFYLDGIYIRQNNQEFIIPITARPDLLKIKNKRLYTVEEIVKNMDNMVKSFANLPDKN